MPELTVQCQIDSYMQTPQQDTNFGGDSVILLGATYAGPTKTFLDRPIANFDVGALAGQQINTAKLVRSIVSLAGGGFAAHIFRCTRPATWTELGVTWKKYDGTTEWTTHGGDWDAAVPTPVPYAEATAFGIHEIFGLGEFVEDALTLRSGIVSLIMKADDENPGANHNLGWNARQTPPGWQLVIDHGSTADLGRRGGAGRGAGATAHAGTPAARPRAGAAPASPVRPTQGAHP